MPTARARHAAETLVRIAQLRRRDRWTREHVERHQRERLTAMVEHAVAHSPFYRDRYRTTGAGPHTRLEALPTLDKPTVMAHFDDLVTDPRLKLADLEAHLSRLSGDELYLGEYRVMATGGTSGVRGIFACDRHEWAMSVASTLRTGPFMGLRTRPGRRLRTASVTAASPVHWGGRYARTSGLGITATLHLDARTPAPEIVDALNRHRPDFLSCYPSIAGILAREQLAGHLTIGPQAVATSGEPCSAEVRALMRKAWGDAVFDGYATTETGFCGMECTRHSGIHLLEDLTIFEAVDDNYRPVPPGTEGRRLLVTNLFNTTLPLVRYELSDMVTLAEEPCPCGRPWRLATAIAGRAEDVLRFAAPGGGTVDVHPTALTGPIERTPGVSEFRIVHEPDALVVSIVPEDRTTADELRRRLTDELERVLRDLGAARCPVRTEAVTALERRGIAGKAKLVEERGGPASGSLSGRTRTESSQ